MKINNLIISTNLKYLFGLTLSLLYINFLSAQTDDSDQYHSVKAKWGIMFSGYVYTIEPKDLVFDDMLTHQKFAFGFRLNYLIPIKERLSLLSDGEFFIGNLERTIGEIEYLANLVTGHQFAVGPHLELGKKGRLGVYSLVGYNKLRIRESPLDITFEEYQLTYNGAGSNGHLREYFNLHGPNDFIDAPDAPEYKRIAFMSGAGLSFDLFEKGGNSMGCRITVEYLAVFNNSRRDDFRFSIGFAL